MLDAAASLLGDDEPHQLYHHAAALEDGRIVQGLASDSFGFQVLVRPRGDEPGAPVLLVPPQRAKITAGVAVHPGGRVYATGEYLRVRIRDADSDESLFDIAEGSSSRVYGMAYSPDGARFAMGTEDGRVLIFDTEFYQKLAEFQLPDNVEGPTRNFVFNLVWAPNGERLITCAQNSIRILESKRAFVRDGRRAIWEQELAERSTVAGRAKRPSHRRRCGRQGSSGGGIPSHPNGGWGTVLTHGRLGPMCPRGVKWS